MGSQVERTESKVVPTLSLSVWLTRSSCWDIINCETEHFYFYFYFFSPATGLFKNFNHGFFKVIAQKKRTDKMIASETDRSLTLLASLLSEIDFTNSKWDEIKVNEPFLIRGLM